MGFFSNKRKISTDDFCREFYDQYIFASELHGRDMWQTLCEKYYQTIADTDRKLSSQMRQFLFKITL